MDIGRESSPVRVEPLTDPVPRREPARPAAPSAPTAPLPGPREPVPA